MPWPNSTGTSQQRADILESLEPRSTAIVQNLVDLKMELIQALQEAKSDNEMAKLLANAEYYRVLIDKLLNPEIKLIREQSRP